MSISVLSAIWNSPPCKGGDLLVLLAIADNADDSGYAWPSMQTIARKAAMSQRGARKCVRKISEQGLIQVEVSKGNGKSNRYQITTCGIGCSNNPQAPGTEFPVGLSAADREQSGPEHPEQPCIDPEQSSPHSEQSDVLPGTGVPANHQEPSYNGIGCDGREEELTFRERVLVAAGHDESGVTATGQFVGNMSQMAAFKKAMTDLRISEDEAVDIVAETTAAKRDGPANNLNYFTKPMQRFAGKRDGPDVSPIIPTKISQRGKCNGNSSTDATLDAIYDAARMRRSPGAFGD